MGGSCWPRLGQVRFTRSKRSPALGWQIYLRLRSRAGMRRAHALACASTLACAYMRPAGRCRPCSPAASRPSSQPAAGRRLRTFATRGPRAGVTQTSTTASAQSCGTPRRSAGRMKRATSGRGSATHACNALESSPSSSSCRLFARTGARSRRGRIPCPAALHAPSAFGRRPPTGSSTCASRSRHVAVGGGGS